MGESQKALMHSDPLMEARSEGGISREGRDRQGSLRLRPWPGSLAVPPAWLDKGRKPAHVMRTR